MNRNDTGDVKLQKYGRKCSVQITWLYVFLLNKFCFLCRTPQIWKYFLVSYGKLTGRNDAVTAGKILYSH